MLTALHLAGPILATLGAYGATALAAPERADADAPALHPSDGPDIDVRIRIESGGVKLRLGPNLAFIDEVCDFERELEDHLDEAEYDPLLHALHETFGAGIAVTIDGARTEPRLVGELEVLPALPSMVRYAPIFGARAQTLCTLELFYECAAEPTQVSILWKPELFPPNWSENSDWALERINIPPPMTVSAQLNDGLGDRPLTFTIEEPEYVWHGEVTTALERFLPVVSAEVPRVLALPIPTVVAALFALVSLVQLLRLSPGRRRAWFASLALSTVASVALVRVGRVEIEVGDAFAVAEADAVAIFEPLHSNMYTAFDYDDRDEIYDALAHCVAGPQLDAVYQQVFRSLIMQDQGGAVSTVQAVRHLDTQLESSGRLAESDADGFWVRTRWQVDGRVTHFGHTHERTQEYAGRFAVGRIGDSWRILGDELLEDFVVGARPMGLPVDRQ